jgi:hypothetical protein
MPANPFSRAMQEMVNPGRSWEDLQKDIKGGLYIPREKVLTGPEKPYCHRSCETRIVVLAGKGLLIRGHVEEMIISVEKVKKITKIRAGCFHCIIPMEKMIVWEVVPKHYLNIDVHWLEDETSRCPFDKGVEKRALVREYFRRRGIPYPETQQIYNFSGPSLEEIRDQLRFEP